MTAIPETGSDLDRRIQAADSVQILLIVRDWLSAHGPVELVDGLICAGGDLCLALGILDSVRRGLLAYPPQAAAGQALLADIDSLIPRSVEQGEGKDESVVVRVDMGDGWGRAK